MDNTVTVATKATSHTDKTHPLTTGAGRKPFTLDNVIDKVEVTDHHNMFIEWVAVNFPDAHGPQVIAMARSTSAWKLYLESPQADAARNSMAIRKAMEEQAAHEEAARVEAAKRAKLAESTDKALKAAVKGLETMHKAGMIDAATLASMLAKLNA